jgi:hypothetical protein
VTASLRVTEKVQELLVILLDLAKASSKELQKVPELEVKPLALVSVGCWA